MSDVLPIAQRPVLRPQGSALTSAAEVLAIAGLVTEVALAWRVWNVLPERIPHHFNFSGEPDAWGGKWLIWILPGISLPLYVGLTWLSSIPHRFNYVRSITQANAAAQYKLAHSLLTFLKSEVIWIFVYIEWATIEVALGRASSLDWRFLPVVLVTIGVTICGHLPLMVRAK